MKENEVDVGNLENSAGRGGLRRSLHGFEAAHKRSSSQEGVTVSTAQRQQTLCQMHKVSTRSEGRVLRGPASLQCIECTVRTAAA